MFGAYSSTAGISDRQQEKVLVEIARIVRAAFDMNVEIDSLAVQRFLLLLNPGPPQELSQVTLIPLNGKTEG